LSGISPFFRKTNTNELRSARTKIACETHMKMKQDNFEEKLGDGWMLDIMWLAKNALKISQWLEMLIYKLDQKSD
jgi:hypothetical protein